MLELYHVRRRIHHAFSLARQVGILHGQSSLVSSGTLEYYVAASDDYGLALVHLRVVIGGCMKDKVPFRKVEHYVFSRIRMRECYLVACIIGFRFTQCRSQHIDECFPVREIICAVRSVCLYIIYGVAVACRACPVSIFCNSHFRRGRFPMVISGV